MRKIVRCWTEEELKILKDNYLTLTQRELAKLLGRTQRAVGHKLCLLGWFVSEEEHSRRTGEALRATILSRNITGENNPHWKGGVSKDSSRYNKRYKERYPEKFKAHPNSCISKFINAYKSASSRLIKKEFSSVRKQLWKEMFWSRSFCILTVGGAPLEILKTYIASQGGGSTE